MQRTVITILLLIVSALVAGPLAWRRYHVERTETKVNAEVQGFGRDMKAVVEKANQDPEKALAEFKTKPGAESKPATVPTVKPEQKN